MECCKYVLRETDNEISLMTRRLLNHMDQVYTSLYNDEVLSQETDSDGQKDGNWLQADISLFYREHWSDNRLSYALEAGLASYVIGEVSNNPEIVKSKQGRPLLHYAVFLLNQNVSPAQHIRQNLPVIRCLLEHHSDPNELFDGLSAAQILLTNAAGCAPSNFLKWRHQSESAGKWNWWQAIFLMLDHGADLEVKPQGLPSLAEQTSLGTQEILLLQGLNSGKGVWKAIQERLGESSWEIQVSLARWLHSLDRSRIPQAQISYGFLNFERGPAIQALSEMSTTTAAAATTHE